MTTNSPNPVDGDVQALIEHCKTMIDASAFPETKKVAEIALAALTAEPVYQVFSTQLGMWVDSDKDSYDDYRHIPGHRRIIYTTPPAQLFRPVELPKKIERDDADGYWMHKSGRVSAVNAAYFNEAIKECAEALRQQGYEVKS